MKCVVTEEICPDAGVCKDLTSCDNGTCQYTDLTGPLCDDGSSCTEDDTCTAGSCAGTTIDGACDDGNPCTNDVCDPEEGGCTHVTIEGCENTLCAVSTRTAAKRGGNGVVSSTWLDV